MSTPTPTTPGLGPVLLTALLDLVGFGLIIPMMSFYAERFHASPVEVTGLMASYSVAQFLFAPVWGSISDRFGRRPVMLASVAATAVFLSLFASATELWQLYLWRALHGAAAANIGAAQAYVADVTTPETRARGMGLIGAAFGLGFTLGPLMGGVLSAKVGLTAPIWLAAGLSAANFVWAFFRLPESRRFGDAPGGHGRVMDPRLVASVLARPFVGSVIGLAAVGTLAFGMLEATFGLTAEHDWGMTPDNVGYLFGTIGVVGIVIQGGLIGRLVKRHGETPLLVIGYALTATGMIVLSLTRPGALWIGSGAPTIALGCLVLATGTSLTNPSITSLLSKSAGTEEQGRVLGVNQSLGALARAVAPTCGGMLFDRWFHGGAFAAGACLVVVALAFGGPSVLCGRPAR